MTIEGHEPFLYCADLTDGSSCCQSCHDDHTLGLTGLAEYDHEHLPGLVPDGGLAFLCCTAYEAIIFGMIE